MKRIGCLSLLLLALHAGPARFAAGSVISPQVHEQADSLYRRALELLARDTFDTRRQARLTLEEATLLEPKNPTYQLALARACYTAGFLKYARKRYEIVARLRPKDADGPLGLGLVWRREWLKYLDPGSLRRAAGYLASATRLDPGRTDAWLALAPLRMWQGDVQAAIDAGFAAARCDPARPEANLALAHGLYRAGRGAEAESVWRATIPRLPRPVRDRFEDISPVAAERDTAILHHLPASRQPAFIETFWAGNDPDLSTPENEARLEYWSRVTQAYFLFFDARRREWDERGEVYVRYGPPSVVAYNALGEPLRTGFHTGPAYPLNLLEWDYPDLGMIVRLEDRLLSERYLFPIQMNSSPDPQPNPDSLARRAGLVTANGRGVFHLLPPGVHPLPMEGAIARFEGAERPRLLAQLECPGPPADTAMAWADWAVLDSARAVRARARTALSPSACQAASRQVADFTADLEPGTYTVAVTVRDGASRRGVLRRDVRLAPARAGLALSDLVLACGAPEGGPTVRIRPNPTRRVPRGGPLTAYFEIYRLAADDDGLARFQYVYTVRPVARQDRHWLQKLFTPGVPAAVSVSRAEEHVGPLRRQFITVPVVSLPPGPYRLEVTVRDLVAGTEQTRRVEFEKAAD